LFLLFLLFLFLLLLLLLLNVRKSYIGDYHRPPRAVELLGVFNHQKSSRAVSSYSMHSMQNELGALGTMRRGGW
jgi:hypothetical protein